MPFEILKEVAGGEARLGLLRTAHGVVETPGFVAVATRGAVRAVSMEDLEALGVQILIANTYHLVVRPGPESVAELGGLHGFTGWRGPWMTDSG
ncbi:MAG: tRNA-guanine transglycosylase, partial [Candidatus Bipolaricaulaceae bacterium]